MMAAVAISENSTDPIKGSSGNNLPPKVILLEKNSYLGAKVLISGGGRCNVTTGVFDVKKLIGNYPRGGKFLLSAMYRFPPDKVVGWFREHGVKMKIEEDLRVFPASDNGKDVVGKLEKILKENGVQTVFNANVVAVSKNEKFEIALKDGQKFEADCVVLTCGGSAYRNTGSTGDGYTFAMNIGHSITKLAPSLSSFLLKENVAIASGVSFKKVGLKMVGAEKNYERTGPFLFTHKGISGPAVFAISAMVAYENYDEQHPLELLVNFFPDEKSEDLEKKFLQMIDQHGKKRLVNLLDMILPKSFCELFLNLIKLNPNLMGFQINKDQRRKILQALQSFKLTVIGRGAGDEFVTAGGVKLEEVNQNTMESKICPGLYFAGEILDVDGFTGGFNLQAAWATGKLAGESIVD